MRNRIILTGAAALAGAVAAYLFVGASGAGGAATSPTDSAQAPAVTVPPDIPATTRTISVTGHGEASGTPDVAELSIGVTSRDKSAADALSAMSARADKLIDVIKAAGVADKDVVTTGLSIQPTTDNGGAITGYEASTTVVATIRDISKVGPSIDAATQQVGDDVRLDGVDFSFSDTGALMGAARADAVKQAQTQAAQLASAAGQQLGQVLSISEDTTSTPIPVPAAGGAASAASVPVQPGTQSVSVDVTMVFALQ
jgi:uncharacterized protein YggE